MLTSKWHTLNANCQKFNATYKRAKRLGKSGENDVDVIKQAQSIYRDEHKGVAFCQEDAWAILKFHLKWDAPEQVDLTGDVPGATQDDLFGHDARPRPAGKPRPAKKTKSDATASTGESSASTQFGELMEQELRLKREAAERAFEAQAEKDRTLMRLEELRGVYENKEVNGVIWCYDKESGVSVGVMLMLNSRGALAKLKEDLRMFDKATDKGNSPVEMVHKRLETLNKIQQ
nr:glutathione S-transferase T3-like [Tanacetum cinerariifolium]